MFGGSTPQISVLQDPVKLPPKFLRNVFQTLHFLTRLNPGNPQVSQLGHPLHCGSRNFASPVLPVPPALDSLLSTSNQHSSDSYLTCSRYCRYMTSLRTRCRTTEYSTSKNPRAPTR